MPKLTTIVAPSCFGKSTYINRHADQYPHVEILKKITTRPHKQNDDSVSVSEDQFSELLIKINGHSHSWQNGSYQTMISLKKPCEDSNGTHYIVTTRHPLGAIGLTEKARSLGINSKLYAFVPEPEFMIHRMSQVAKTHSNELAHVYRSRINSLSKYYDQIDENLAKFDKVWYQNSFPEPTIIFR